MMTPPESKKSLQNPHTITTPLIHIRGSDPPYTTIYKNSLINPIHPAKKNT